MDVSGQEAGLLGKVLAQDPGKNESQRYGQHFANKLKPCLAPLSLALKFVQTRHQRGGELHQQERQQIGKDARCHHREARHHFPSGKQVHGAEQRIVSQEVVQSFLIHLSTQPSAAVLKFSSCRLAYRCSFRNRFIAIARFPLAERHYSETRRCTRPGQWNARSRNVYEVVGNHAAQCRAIPISSTQSHPTCFLDSLVFLLAFVVSKACN